MDAHAAKTISDLDKIANKTGLKWTLAGIAIMVVAICTILGILFTVDYIRDQEPNGIIRNKVTIPTGATDLTDIGDDWYTFKYRGITFLYHKKISYADGYTIEALGRMEISEDQFIDHLKTMHAKQLHDMGLLDEVNVNK